MLIELNFINDEKFINIFKHCIIIAVILVSWVFIKS